MSTNSNGVLGNILANNEIVESFSMKDSNIVKIKLRVGQYDLKLSNVRGDCGGGSYVLIQSPYITPDWVSIADGGTQFANIDAACHT